MYSILLAVKRPNVVDHDNVEKYDKLCRILEGLSRQNKSIRLFSESTILLPLDSGLQALADVVNAIGRLPYTYAIVTKEIQWHEATNKV
uniref:Thiamine-binding protein domain-containing protein n=1 Tax=viral metagenome TaxID=1070528 RepID=A0A6M3KXR3_9ZZZZ